MFAQAFRRVPAGQRADVPRRAPAAADRQPAYGAPICRLRSCRRPVVHLAAPGRGVDRSVTRFVDLVLHSCERGMTTELLEHLLGPAFGGSPRFPHMNYHIKTKSERRRRPRRVQPQSRARALCDSWWLSINQLRIGFCAALLRGQSCQAAS